METAAMPKLRRVLVALVLLASIACFADTVDFVASIPPTSPQLPYIFPASSATFGPLTVTAWAFTGSWTKSVLTGRNDDVAAVSLHDHGLGVCSEGDSTFV